MNRPDMSRRTVLRSAVASSLLFPGLLSELLAADDPAPRAAGPVIGKLATPGRPIIPSAEIASLRRTRGQIGRAHV